MTDKGPGKGVAPGRRVLALAAAAALLAAACGATTSPSPSGTAAPPTSEASAAPSAAGYQGPETTISYSIWGDPAEIKNQQAIVDDFHAVRDRVLKERLRHLPAAEALVAAEAERFLKDWSRRKVGPAIAQLSQGCDAIRRQVQEECLAKLNGKLTPEAKAVVEGALKLLQNRLLHAPISALQEEAKAGHGRGLLEALKKLFRLGDG